MALIVREGALAQRPVLPSLKAIDVTKVVVWIAGAALPWMAIFFAARFVLAAMA
jgi:hypothetical protein